ncbi:mitochondrial proton/calcium exchanger protein-like protein isoform X1 [Tanacetum coccineum]
MAETIEQYMSKTRADYGLGFSRPKIEDKDNFKLKGQFLKELRTNTFSGSDHEDVNEHIEKVLKIMDLFHVPNITIDQVMLRAFFMSLTRAASRWLRNKPSGSITTWEDLKIKFLSKYCQLARSAKKMEEINNFQQELDKNLYQARQILDSRGAIPSKTATDVKVAIQEIAEYSQKWYNGTSRTKEEEKTLEEAYYTQFGAPFQGWGYRATTLGFYQRNNGNPLYQERRKSMEETLRKFMGESAKIHEENFNLIKEIRASTDDYIRNQGASIKTLEIQIGKISKSISTIVEADASSIRRIGSHQYAVSTEQNSALMYETRQVTIPFPSQAYSYGALHIDKSIPRKEKDPGSFTLPFYINNVFFDNALADLGASIDVFKRKITLRVREEKIIFKSIKPASSLIKRVYMLSLKERIELDLEASLIGETLVLNRSLDPFFEDYIELNDLNVPLELRRDQDDYLMLTIEEGEVIEEFKARNDARMVSKILGYPNFAVLEDMNTYRDEGMGDVIFSEPFLREVGINTKRFEVMITIYNGNKELTYQMVRSHLRFLDTAYSSLWIRHIGLLTSLKEIDEVGEVSTI